MNTTILTRDGTRVMGISAAMLVAMLAALLAVFVLAKPSGAATTVTVDPLTVGFGTDVVGGTATTPRTILVTNNGSTTVTIGGASTTITGPDAGDFDLLPQVIDTLTGLPLLGEDLTTGVILGAGETVELQVQFNASAAEVRDAVLKLTDDTGNTLQNVNLTGTGVNQLNPDAVSQGCTIIGTNRRDTLTGTPGDDVICALRGSDRADGRGGDDTIRGGRGKDRLKDRIGADADKLFGQGGIDRLNSRDGDGNDVVNGGPKRDKVRKDKGDLGKRR